MITSPLILCERLLKVYRIGELEVQALQGLDLTVSAGELMGIVGASGSGKSTLLNILGGLDRPTAGKVIVDGQNLLSISDTALTRYRQKTAGFVWQQSARNLVPYLTALENVQLPLTLAGQIGRRARDRAVGLLKTVGLADRQVHRLVQLSGGEQQRVAIAVALVNEPKLLLADEPTGEVDTATAQIIYGLFRALSLDRGLTVLIVSHDAGIAQYVNRVVAVRDGKLATETLRYAGAAGAESEVLEEWAVLDSAGRLQIPKEYLQRFDMDRRVQLELRPDGVLIRPGPRIEGPTLENTDVSDLSAVTVKAETRRWWRWLKSPRKPLS